MASAGTVTLYGKTSANPWVSPGTTQALAGDDLTNKRILFFGSQSFRYWAFVFDDVQNTAGYTEVGILFVGTYWQPARGYEHGGTRQAEQLFEVVRADQGAAFVLSRNSPKTHAVNLAFMSRADRDSYQTIEDLHGHLFFARDPNYPGADTVYGVISATASVSDETVEPPVYRFSLTLTENLG
jgi:hypothetical protein